MMRKRLVFTSMIGLLFLLLLIIYNLMFTGASTTSFKEKTQAAPIDIANPTDTAWFNAPSAPQPVVALLPIRRLPPLPPPMTDPEQHAVQAPISSNQINNEIKNFESLQNHPSADNGHDHVIKPLAEHVDDEDYLKNTLQKPRSVFEIKAGAIIPAILISGINSDLPGPITAQVRENIYDSTTGRYLLVPQGARLQGIYDSKIVYGQKRLLIAWQRMIFPNGQSLNLSGMPGTDVRGYAGFTDQVNNHYQRVFSSALLMSVIGAGLQLSQPQLSGDNNTLSVNQLLAQNAGINLSQTSDQLLRKNLNIKPTLEVRPGYLFNISVVKDIIFPGPS